MNHINIDAFQAIADPNRREILNLLTKNSLTINAVADNFEMSRPAVSKHIKILYSAGFIIIENVGRERYCKLNQKGFNDLQQWINYFEKFWTIKLDALEKFLSTSTAHTSKLKKTKK